MSDDTNILEGAVKFREGKKWKARWGVLRRLSPVADAVELSLWSERPSPSCCARLKAALSLRRWLGAVSGFTLDRHSHTLALLCADCEAVLAFEGREQLVAWSARLGALLGTSRDHEVVTAKGKGSLLVTARTLALVAGVPPVVQGVWEIQHLRRFGAVEGMFVWEGGALSGAGGGAHSVRAGDVARIARDVATAAGNAAGNAASCGSPPSSRAVSEAGTVRRLPRCASCSAALGTAHPSFGAAWTMAPAARASRPHRLPLPPGRPRRDDPCSAPAGPYDNYDVPKVPSVEEGEYYDTPRRLRNAVGGMVRSATCGGAGCRWGVGPPDPSPLYATVDVTRKTRRNTPASPRHYENARFARSLHLYENARDLVSGRPGPPRAASAEYLSMRPLPPGGPPAQEYARMRPGGTHALACSDPSLLADCDAAGRSADSPSLPWAGRPGGNRDSSSSGDSGVGGCDPPRRCRSAEPPPPCRPSPPSVAPPFYPGTRSRACDASTSSGTSDLSDYMETLSLSSHSSADVTRCRCRPQPLCALRPRSGREYARPPNPPHPPQPPRPRCRCETTYCGLIGGGSHVT